MTVKLSDTGATVTAGRGRNQLVLLEVSFKELEAWARRMKMNEKNAFRVAYGRAIKGLRDKFRKVITNAGGVEGVPKFRDFEAFTKELRAVKGKTSPMGGILAEKGAIVAYQRNGWQYIGWPDKLAEWAVNFQDGVGGQHAESCFTDPALRRIWHKRGIKDIPRAYVHNPRRVIPEPFGSYVDKHLEQWAQDALHKAMAREMARRES